MGSRIGARRGTRTPLREKLEDELVRIIRLHESTADLAVSELIRRGWTLSQISAAARAEA